jgi:hypothetical protein
MVMQNGGINQPTGTGYIDPYLQMLQTIYGPTLNYQSNQAANQTAQQGNQLDYMAAMAGIGASTQNAAMDNETRVRVAQIAAREQQLDRSIQNAQWAAQFYHQQGQDAIANQFREAAMQLEREKFGLQREQQAYDNGMTTAEFLQRQDQFNRTFGLDVSRFNSDEANRAFQNNMAGALFQQNQQDAERQYGLQRSDLQLRQQQSGAQQALDYNRFGLDQQRFALDRDKARAEMAANPYNAFANAYFVRGQAASPAFAPFGTPGSGWAYGYQAQPEMQMPRTQLPSQPKTFGMPNGPMQGGIRPPTYNGPPPPNWLKFGTNPKPPGVA